MHVDHCDLHPAEGRLRMVLAIDRVSEFTHVAFSDAATEMNGAAFPFEVVAASPYAIHTVLTDNGMAFWENRTVRLPRRRRAASHSA